VVPPSPTCPSVVGFILVLKPLLFFSQPLTSLPSILCSTTHSYPNNTPTPHLIHPQVSHQHDRQHRRRSQPHSSRDRDPLRHVQGHEVQARRKINPETTERSQPTNTIVNLGRHGTVCHPRQLLDRRQRHYQPRQSPEEGEGRRSRRTRV
jgi:hypothetical protein